jgi:hypothetical protein
VINYSTITTALAAQLLADSSVYAVLSEKYIERGGPINENAGRAPWLGVYRSAITHDPRTLGSTQNWESTGVIRVCAQAVSMHSASNCEDSLESLVRLVINAITADTTIGGTVDMVKRFAVDYRYLESDRKSMFFQMAIIAVTFEVKSP